MTWQHVSHEQIRVICEEVTYSPYTTAYKLGTVTAIANKAVDAWLEGQESVAALVEVRRPHGPWQRYNVYDSVAVAKATEARVSGEGLEVRVVPLYANQRQEV